MRDHQLLLAVVNVRSEEDNRVEILHRHNYELAHVIWLPTYASGRTSIGIKNNWEVLLWHKSKVGVYCLNGAEWEGRRIESENSQPQVRVWGQQFVVADSSWIYVEKEQLESKGEKEFQAM